MRVLFLFRGRYIPVGHLSCGYRVICINTNETLAKYTKEIDGHDTPRKIDAFATDAYYCIVCFLHMICVQGSKSVCILTCFLISHALYFLYA